MPNSLPDAESEKQKLDTLRRLLFGRDGKELCSALEPQAKSLVRDVITEALHERQNADNSIVPVIQPIIQSSVENSVSQQSDKLTTILYPLVGSMVRKAVAAFLNQFIEKTNALIENAVSIKGWIMRYEAWRAGIPFSQYLVSQAYSYKVETVLLIHRETGTLLNHISNSSHESDNADLVSSMLSAINDFVSDSFAEHDNLQQLDEVKTDDVSLYVCHGPNAILAVASNGSIPSQDRETFIKTLEQIHGVFSDELHSYNGDASSFSTVDNLLYNCILTQKKDANEKANRPWFGYVFLLLAMTLLIGYSVLKYRAYSTLHSLQSISALPGYVLTSGRIKNVDKVTINVLRDPMTKTIESWISENNLNGKNIQIKEQSYISLEPEIVILKLESVIEQYQELSMDSSYKITGEIEWQKNQAFLTELNAIPGISQLNVDTSLVSVITIDKVDNNAVLFTLFKQYIGQIAQTQIEFYQNHTNLADAAVQEVIKVSSIITQAQTIADKLDIQFNLLVIGTSDSAGNENTNFTLSSKRAASVKALLAKNKVDTKNIFDTGIGEVSFTSGENAPRRVVFNVIYSPRDK
ncbi:OmpA family protein [Alteromonas sp. 5E99-2]|uniref:OmpA family protein n=1 Tax=Alteromonas sp. 5E99-2 TaxID=2817683 RepID=UPI001A99414D|nr:OmpA family protein [Alteromonas sp. 5E99-2]MBO1254972.1 OmpA family protein [Alteromonas sp. 5E99-2]